MKVVLGKGVGKGASLLPGCAAVAWEDARRRKILLTRRADNGRWCLPGGGMESGETAADAVVREVFEETGVRVRVTRLIGIYTSPDIVIEYRDGKRHQLVAMSFEAEIVGGEPGLSDETTECGFFTPDEIASMDLVEHHRQRIADALEYRAEAFVR